MTVLIDPFFLPVVFMFFVRLLRRSRLKIRYPPGPRRHPLVGHMFQVPTIQPWRYFDRLFHEYGPILKLSMAGDDIIVLRKASDAVELLERRSQIYSSRKPLVYAGRYQSRNRRLVLMPYSNDLKKQRTAFHQMLQPRAIGAYEAIQEQASTNLLHDMLTCPALHSRHCQNFGASLVFHLSYGKSLQQGDADLRTIIKILEDLIHDTYPGTHIVDTFPILDYLPFFLAPWRRKATKKYNYALDFYKRMALQVKAEMDSGKENVDSFAARLWEDQQKTKLDVDELAFTAGTAVEAGTDTTPATIQWFLMAMILFPNAMLKAQDEIDSVLGMDGKTVPCLSHINDLPYCTALTREVFRWAPAAPGGFPHYSIADDEYQGYTIYKNTTIIPCIWSMHRDEEMYPDPHEFKPERFLNDESSSINLQESLTQGHYAFGFGRRKCPAQHLAAKSIWLVVTKLLWAFNIGPQLDSHGKPVPVDPDNCTSGMSSRPKDFPVVMIPRSMKHVQTIKKEWEATRS